MSLVYVSGGVKVEYAPASQNIQNRETTIEMPATSTMLDAGWDFVGETANGTEDIWWIDEGKDYPRLWWELPEGGESAEK